MSYADPHKVLDLIDSLTRHHMAKKDLRQKQLDRLPLKPGDRVLDIGVGPGLYLKYWLEATKEQAVHFTLLDSNDDFLERCLSIAKETHNLHRVQVVQDDFLSLEKLRNENFDLVFIGNTLEYIQDATSYLRNRIAGLLGADGVLAVRDLDCSYMRCEQFNPELNQKILNSRIESCRLHSKRTGIFHDPFIGKHLGGILELAGFQSVELIPYTAEFRGPLSTEAKSYLAALHAEPGWYLENVDQSLNSEDIKIWRDGFSPENPNSFINSPAFRYREAEFMALGQRPPIEAP